MKAMTLLAAVPARRTTIDSLTRLAISCRGVHLGREMGLRRKADPLRPSFQQLAPGWDETDLRVGRSCSNFINGGFSAADQFRCGNGGG